MSLSEQSRWVRYEAAHGTLDPFRRSDVASAIVAAQMTRLKTGRSRVDLEPFLPFEKGQDDTPDGGDAFEAVAGLMGARKSDGKQ